MMIRKILISTAVMVGVATLALSQTGCSRASPAPNGVVFTADEKGKSISVVDPDTGRVTTTPVRVAPHNVQTSRDGKSLYVVGSLMGDGEGITPGMSGKGRLLVFNSTAVASGPVADIEVGRMPAHVIVDDPARRAYVTNGGDNVVLVIDLSSAKIAGSIKVGSSPHGLRMSPDG